MSFPTRTVLIMAVMDGTAIMGRKRARGFFDTELVRNWVNLDFTES